MSRVTLTDQEAAYLRRFCYESHFGLEGPGTAHAECRGHWHDVGIWAAIYGMEMPVHYWIEEALIEGKSRDAIARDYPKVEFPWESLAELRRRSLEARGYEGAV